ncbi:MAG: TIGR04282 family arsenosugar biosynthesis glycosyltransferase [Planctomycetota bacterium]
MARYWAEGPVKTRLARVIGQDRARAIYKELAETVWRGLRHESRAGKLERFLFVEPASKVNETAEWLGGADHFEGQASGDLGRRLVAAFERAFGTGVDRAAVVGTDAPTVDAELCRRALDELEDHEVVIVPALDGGYALLGLARVVPELFSDMPWSTDQVCRESVTRAERLGLRVALLEPVRDIDEISDWQAFESERS